MTKVKMLKRHSRFYSKRFGDYLTHTTSIKLNFCTVNTCNTTQIRCIVLVNGLIKNKWGNKRNHWISKMLCVTVFWGRINPLEGLKEQLIGLSSSQYNSNLIICNVSTSITHQVQLYLENKAKNVKILHYK